MVDFTRAFGSAWERMVIILFRPFDFGKWLAIALSAFLAALPSGGNGADFSPSLPSNLPQKDQNHTGLNPHHDGLYTFAGAPHAGFNLTALNPFTPGQSPQQIVDQLSNLIGTWSTGFMVLLFGGLVIFIFLLSILLYWLGSHGQFMLLDNIVRNRGAISAPWNFYSARANRVFVFYLLTLLAVFALILVIVLPVILIAGFSIHGNNWSAPAVIAIIVLALLYLAAVIAFSVALFIFREWTIPLIFRNGWDVMPAIRETWLVIKANAGSTALFILLRIALFVAMLVISNILCLFTCCGERLPYVGTVFLLPAIIYLRCFSLDVLAQFGPQYDVFTVDLPPTTPGATAAPSPFSPPPQLG